MDDIQKELKKFKKDRRHREKIRNVKTDTGFNPKEKSKQNDLLDILMKSDIIDNRNKSTMIRQLITEFPCLMSQKKGL